MYLTYTKISFSSKVPVLLWGQRSHAIANAICWENCLFFRCCDWF